MKKIFRSSSDKKKQHSTEDVSGKKSGESEKGHEGSEGRASPYENVSGKKSTGLHFGGDPASLLLGITKVGMGSEDGGSEGRSTVRTGGGDDASMSHGGTKGGAGGQSGESSTVTTEYITYSSSTNGSDGASTLKLSENMPSMEEMLKNAKVTKSVTNNGNTETTSSYYHWSDASPSTGGTVKTESSSSSARSGSLSASGKAGGDGSPRISKSGGGGEGRITSSTSTTSYATNPSGGGSISGGAGGAGGTGASRVNASMDDVSGLRSDGQLAEWLENDAKAGSPSTASKMAGSQRMSAELSPSGNVKRPTPVRAKPNGSQQMNGSPSPSPGNAALISRLSASSPFLLDDKERPMSPTTRLISLSRIDEKNQLVSLNDRLAGILSKNRNLENENVILNTQLKDANAKLTLITNELTKTFEFETSNLRTQLQDAQKERVRLEMALKKLQKDYDALLEQLRDRDDEITKSQRNIKILETRITRLTTDMKKKDDDQGKLAKEKADLVDRLANVTKELESTQKQYEEEAMTKVELEGMLRNKEDEVQMKMQIHQQQFSELMVSRNDEASNMGGQLQKEYDARLADAIQQLRAECEMQLQANREEQEGLYAKKEQALQAEMQRLRISLEVNGGEMSAMTLKLSALERKMAQLASEKADLEGQLQDLEGGWAADKAAFAAERARLEGLINEMQEERFQLLTDYQQLMEIKVGLDNEISTYRSLLQSEEDRLTAAEEERMQMQLEAQVTPSFEIKRTVRTVTSMEPEYIGGGGGGSGAFVMTSSGGGSGGGSSGFVMNSSGGGGGGGSSGFVMSSSGDGGSGGGSQGSMSGGSGGGSGRSGFSVTSPGGGSSSSSSGGVQYTYTTSSSKGQEPEKTQTYKYESRF